MLPEEAPLGGCQGSPRGAPRASRGGPQERPGRLPEAPKSATVQRFRCFLTASKPTQKGTLGVFLAGPLGSF